MRPLGARRGSASASGAPPPGQSGLTVSAHQPPLSSLGRSVSSPSVLFLEFQAGEGRLTQAVAAAGVAALPPDELESGGVNFTSRAELKALRVRLKKLREEGHHLIVHLAPPCATFSLARNRAKRTQLRSSARPGGLPRLGEAARARVAEANIVALESFALAAWAHGELRQS